MIGLHDFAASANCFKVRMLLSQLGLPYERLPVDIFAGDSQTADYLALNPAGRTPLLVTEGGAAIPESGAILLYLAEGTPLLPDDPIERAHVHAWMFFEQNLLEPNVGTARFWRLTGRDGEQPEAFARHLEAGAGALAVLERGLTGKDFLVGGRYTVADCALYAYTRVAPEAGYELAAYPAVVAWLARVAATPGAIDDLEPYPAAAHAGAGGRSVHDRWWCPAAAGHRGYVRASNPDVRLKLDITPSDPPTCHREKRLRRRLLTRSGRRPSPRTPPRTGCSPRGCG